MNEYISREEIVSEIRSRVSIAEDLQEIGYNTAMAEMMQWIKHIPATDVEPVRHGQWIHKSEDYSCRFECSACKTEVNDIPTLMGKPLFDYCPYCGAKMYGGAEQ